MGFDTDDEEVLQVVNDMLGILERSDLNWYECIAASRLLEKSLWSQVDYSYKGGF